MRSTPRCWRGPGIVRPRRRGTRGFRPDVQGLEPRQLLSGADPNQPTANEQYMLEVINQARANPAAEAQRLLAIAQTDPLIRAMAQNTNLTQFVQVMSSYGPEPPLAFNTRLIEAARDHDAAMLAVNNQFHAPSGYLNDPRVATASDGQAYYPTGTGAWATGENIFAYSGNVANDSLQDVVNYFDEAFFLDWGNPDFGHLKNLLTPGPGASSDGTTAVFREIGVGLLTGVTPTVPPSQDNPIPTNRGLNVGPDLVTQEFGWRSGNAILTGVFYQDNDHNGSYTPGEGLGSVTITAVGRHGEGSFQTQTWDSGGYSLPLLPGTYDVTAKGNLPSPQVTTVTIGQDNIAWEVRIAPTPTVPPPSSPTPTNPPSSSPTATVPSSTSPASPIPSPSDPAPTVPSPSSPAPVNQAQASTVPADLPIPGDYNGDGKTALAVYRSSTAQWFIDGQDQPISFGAANLDIPVPGDYDRSGHTEIAVYRPSTAQWFIGGHASPISFGAANLDIPVPGDYDGSGHTEIAVYRPSTGQWFIGGHAAPISFGAANLDIPVPGDYDGSGHTEIAVYRPSTAQWFIGGHASPISFGAAGLDVPVPGDYDGSGMTEVAVFRPSTAQWFVGGSSTMAQGQPFGQGGTSAPVSSWLTASALSPGSPVVRIAVSDASTSAGQGQALDPSSSADQRHRVLSRRGLHKNHPAPQPADGSHNGLYGHRHGTGRIHF